MQRILGYSVYSQNGSCCVDDIFNFLINTRSKGWLACLNPHSYAVACSDLLFANALKSADWLVPDGVGVVLASRLLGGSIASRVTGSDVFLGLHARLNDSGGGRVFFLGATDGTLEKIQNKMAVDYPNVEVVGVYSPPFKSSYSDAEIDEMIESINAARVDVLWVGMTAPKQEKWIFENLDRLDVRFCGAVGAVFDFYVGNVKRSHPIFQRLGLEWMPRLVQQPRRLWRRTFVSAPKFIVDVLREKINH